jgi:quercetin dioxygenase-like cupin family protein
LDAIRTADLVDDLLAAARGSGSGRGARTIHGGRDHALRQTVIALADGRSLDEHESPGEATILVLSGRVRLVAGEDSSELGPGEFVVIPPLRHHLDALEDSAVLLTVAMTEAAAG